MKFGQLIEYNMRYTTPQNVVKKLFPDSFLKNQNWAYLWINCLKFCPVCFFFCMPIEGYQNILKLSCRLLSFTSYKALLKNKKSSGTSLPASFSGWFFKNNISLVIFSYLTKFHCLVLFTSCNIGKYVCCNYLLTSLWLRRFWN